MLTIKRPTPTTVLYTVSTRSQSKTLTSRLSTYGAILLRVAAGLLITTILYHDFTTGYSHQYQLPGLITELLTRFYELIGLTFHWRLALCAIAGWLISRKGYTEESLLVIRGLGVQTSTSSSSWLWSGSTRFIPTASIRDVFLHEAFQGFEVRFYLSIVVEGEEDVVVVFPKILPRREVLEEVWRGVRRCLYEVKS